MPFFVRISDFFTIINTFIITVFSISIYLITSLHIFCVNPIFIFELFIAPLIVTFYSQLLNDYSMTDLKIWRMIVHVTSFLISSPEY